MNEEEKRNTTYDDLLPGDLLVSRRLPRAFSDRHVTEMLLIIQMTRRVRSSDDVVVITFTCLNVTPHRVLPTPSLFTFSSRSIDNVFGLVGYDAEHLIRREQEEKGTREEEDAR